jgi:hypothetical protein
MKPVFIPVLAFLVLLCVLVSGCTSGNSTPPATTPVPTTVLTRPPTTAPATPAVPVTTGAVVADNGPVQPLPSAQQVNLELTKDRPTSKISLLYQGGPGEMFTQQILMHVYSADGTYQEYAMDDGKTKPIPGDEIIAPGTRDGDRCVVYVKSAGTSYKVIDQQVFAARI